MSFSSRLVATSLSYRGPGATSIFETALFEHLDFALGDEVVGLVGPNGCGKSTLLRLLAGEESPHSGSVVRHGTVRLLRQDAANNFAGTVEDALAIAQTRRALHRLTAGTGTPSDVDIVNDRWEVETEARAELDRAGLATVEFERPVSTLSGGERARLALAKCALSPPDILLLDEPSNHLDVAARTSLRAWIARRDGATVIASHDRELLAMADRIVEFRDGELHQFGGAYEQWREARRHEEQRTQENAEEAMRIARAVRKKRQREREKKDKRDARGRASRSTGSQPKVALNVNRERAQKTGARLASVDKRQNSEAQTNIETTVSHRVRAPRVTFSTPLVQNPDGKTMLSMDAVSWAPTDKPVLHDVTLEICGRQRVALVGENGAGKSTLLQLAVGLLRPTTGRVKCIREVGYVDQHASFLRHGVSVVSNLLEVCPTLTEPAARELLASYGFRRERVFQDVTSLSGGERTRAALACALLRIPAPQLLVLDEPDNHLDPWALEFLLEALEKFGGAILVASHQQRLLSDLRCHRFVALERGHVVSDRDEGIERSL